jgi:hypothetical protein
MITDTKTTQTMVPVSGRIPEDLYQWLATHSLEGAATMSDKLRVAVSTLKRLHDGDSEYNDALALIRDMGRNTRESISRLEQAHGHSEVTAAVYEHALAMAASLMSAQVATFEDAVTLEERLVRRAMQLSEALLRQGVTSQASAFDPQVIQKHADRVIELVRVLAANQIAKQQKGSTHE